MLWSRASQVMKETVRDLIDAVVRVSPVEPQEIERALGISLARTGGLPPVEWYEGALEGVLYAKVDFRRNLETGMRLLVLSPCEECLIHEDDLDVARYGPIATIDMNPNIPPEGTQAFLKDVRGVRVSWQFTMRSRTLRCLTFEWRA